MAPRFLRADRPRGNAPRSAGMAPAAERCAPAAQRRAAPAARHARAAERRTAGESGAPSRVGVAARTALMPASLGRFRGGLAGGLPWAALACLAAFACRANPGAGGDGSQPAAAAASAPALPPLVLKDDTPNLLLTWVGAEGDFHVAE